MMNSLWHNAEKRDDDQHQQQLKHSTEKLKHTKNLNGYNYQNYTGNCNNWWKMTDKTFLLCCGHNDFFQNTFKCNENNYVDI